MYVRCNVTKSKITVLSLQIRPSQTHPHRQIRHTNLQHFLYQNRQIRHTDLLPTPSNMSHGLTDAVEYVTLTYGTYRHRQIGYTDLHILTYRRRQIRHPCRQPDLHRSHTTKPPSQQTQRRAI